MPVSWACWDISLLEIKISEINTKKSSSSTGQPKPDLLGLRQAQIWKHTLNLLSTSQVPVLLKHWTKQLDLNVSRDEFASLLASKNFYFTNSQKLIPRVQRHITPPVGLSAASGPPFLNVVPVTNTELWMLKCPIDWVETISNCYQHKTWCVIWKWVTRKQSTSRRSHSFWVKYRDAKQTSMNNLLQQSVL